MQRWTFPLVPDTNLLPQGGDWGASSFRLNRSFTYKYAHAVLLTTVYIFCQPIMWSSK